MLPVKAFIYKMMTCVYPGESLADVKECWSGDRVSEVRGGEQQGCHLQIDQLQTQKQEYTAEVVSFVPPKRGQKVAG